MKEIYFIPATTPEELKVLVLTLSDSDKEKFPQTLESIKWNNDKTKCILSIKPNEEIPEVLANEKQYTKKQAQLEIKKTEWTPKEL